MHDNGARHSTTMQSRWQLIWDIQGRASIEDSELDALRRILAEIGHGRDLALSINELVIRAFLTYHFGEVLALNHTCEHDLLLVLRKDPTNAMALMYLGHQCFDESRFEEVKSYFERLSLSHDNSDRLKCWRTKICELIISCNLMMHRFNEVAEPAAALVHALYNADPSELAAPIELIRSLAANATDFTNAIRDDYPITWVRHLRRIARDHGVEQSLNYELSRIDRACDSHAGKNVRETD